MPVINYSATIRFVRHERLGCWTLDIRASVRGNNERWCRCQLTFCFNNRWSLFRCILLLRWVDNGSSFVSVCDGNRAHYKLLITLVFRWRKALIPLEGDTVHPRRRFTRNQFNFLRHLIAAGVIHRPVVPVYTGDTWAFTLTILLTRTRLRHLIAPNDHDRIRMSCTGVYLGLHQFSQHTNWSLACRHRLETYWNRNGGGMTCIRMLVWQMPCKHKCRSQLSEWTVLTNCDEL